ncbi:aspartate ammonia-lyase [Streptomyces sp. NPDC058067]|uniref:aspartate ammonia-lyase n=1 Tax=Streptomyces sp. NPDC058067 TaxID=3346324 RepID=UPI0036E78E64
MNTDQTRREQDFLGERAVPADALWGVHTSRALENFPISGTSIARHRELVAALGSVKLAAARANAELGLLDERRLGAIESACGEVIKGLLDDQFVVDVVQGGAGTSTNMNANEVIANRALQVLGLQPGDHAEIHPNDHVNASQSTNDVYPTAVKIALLHGLDNLADAVRTLSEAFAAKGEEFRAVPKVGRTQLQDAVPMTVGQEFSAWAATLAEEQARILDSRGLLSEINLGATAIGTGITADPRYASVVLRHLREITGMPLQTAGDLVEATADTGVFVQLSGVLKRTAVKVSKICNDLRLLSSGPQAGLGELRLPPRQAGSSIMPGKVNPVVPEVVNQVAFWVVGNDVTITMAAEAGQLQLNAFEPIMCHGLLQSMDWMARAFDTLARLCVRDIEVNVAHLEQVSAHSVGVVTALLPHLGYAEASAIAKAALSGEGDVRSLVLRTGTLDEARLDELLDPERLAGVKVTAVVREEAMD